ncbi:MAG: T9SS type A sorting domain-containing protein, partial [Saprospiraceae bacterium]
YVVKSVVYDSITDSYDSSRFYRLNETGHIIDSTTMPRQFIYSSTGGIFSYGRQLPEEFFTFSVCKHSNTDLSIIENELILDYESRFYDVYPDHEGGIIAITREDSILRLDENLNILWDYPESHFGDLIYPGLEYTLVDFFNMSDGGYMVTTGHWNVFSGTMGMLKLNADGNSEWFADFLNTPITSMHSLHETADGGYMFIAHTDVTFDYPHHSWLVKVNNLGLLLSDENLLSDNDTPRINIFPNPVKNTLNISGKIPDDSKAVIYDYSGRILLMQKMEALENSINVSHLDKGMYILKIFNQNQSYAIRFMK